MIGNFPAVLNFNWLFLKLNQVICNSLPVLLDHSMRDPKFFIFHFFENFSHAALGHVCQLAPI